MEEVTRRDADRVRDQLPRPPRSAFRVRLALVLTAACVVGGIYVLASVPPTESSFYPRCQLHSLTGLHCPGCGTTRALHALLNGRVTQAFAYNALAFVVLPVVGWSLARSVWAWNRGRSTDHFGQGATFWVWLLVAVMIAFGVLRNIPLYPLTLLAPHEI